MNLQEYLEVFRTLKVNSSSGHAKPHKACMLLAVIDLLDSGSLTQNRFVFDDRLKDAFSQRFEQYRQGNDKDTPVYPFFHLSSAGFWHLTANVGKEAELQQRLKDSAPGGTGVIKQLVAHASVSPDLFLLLQDASTRSVLAGELEGTLLGPKEAFAQWCRSVGKSDKTISNYLNALGGPISQWASAQQGRSIEIVNTTQAGQIVEIRDALLEYGLYQERNRVGKGMYSAALNLWERYLHEGRATSRIERDISEIEAREIDATVKDTLVRARRGQGLFRNRVLQQWESRCAVTGYADPRFLIASHIKPWQSSDDRERLDRFNGFPFIPSVDKAFDLGFISFDAAGKIMISTELEEPEKLGIREGQSVMLLARHHAYLEYHRASCFSG